MEYCKKCGAYIPIDETKCPACGYDPAEEARQAQQAAAAAAQQAQAEAEREKQEAESFAAQEKKREEEARRRAQEQRAREQRKTGQSGPYQTQYTSQRTGQSGAAQGQSARMAAADSPPMPAMTTVSHSSGRMPRSPSARRKEMRSSTPARRALARARAMQWPLMSEAIADATASFRIIWIGRYA